MYRAKTKDGHPEVSADLPGATARYVEAHFNNAVALWTSGAAGDQNPLFMANYNQDGPDVFDEGAAGYAILDVQARRLGEEIVRERNQSGIQAHRCRYGGKRVLSVVPEERESILLIQTFLARGIWLLPG